MSKKIRNIIANAMPLCAIIAFVAMILACTSSSSSVAGAVEGAASRDKDGGSSAEDSAMLTDSVASPFGDLAAL